MHAIPATPPLDTLLDALAKIYRAETPQQARTALAAWKKIANNAYPTFKDHPDAFIRVFDEFDTIPDDRIKATFCSAMYEVLLHARSASPTHYRACAKFALHALTHPSGRVREAIRHAGTWLRHPDWRDTDRTSKLTEAYHEFIAQLEELIAHHTPSDVPKQIKDMPASVYKSLVLAWYDLAPYTADTLEEWAKKAKERGYPTSDRFYISDADLHTIDSDAAVQTLWQGADAGDPHRARTHLLAMQEHARARFDESLHVFGFPDSEIKSMHSTLRVYGVGVFDTLFPGLLAHLVTTRTIENLDEATPLVREVQAFANHFVFDLPTGEPMSTCLASAVVERMHQGRHVPTDWEAYTLLTLETHRAIDRYFAERLHEHEQFHTAMLARYRHLVIMREDADQYEKEHGKEMHITRAQYKLLASLAHHALDWYLQVAPWSAYQKTPEKLSALVLHFVVEFNREHKRPVHDLPTSSLADFAGYTGVSAISTGWYSVRNAIRGHILDPELLLVPKPRSTKKHRGKKPK